jgi:hypothetical protein
MLYFWIHMIFPFDSIWWCLARIYCINAAELKFG